MNIEMPLGVVQARDAVDALGKVCGKHNRLLQCRRLGDTCVAVVKDATGKVRVLKAEPTRTPQP